MNDKKWVRQTSTKQLEKYAKDNDDRDVNKELVRRQKRRGRRHIS